MTSSFVCSLSSEYVLRNGKMGNVLEKGEREARSIDKRCDLPTSRILFQHKIAQELVYAQK